MRALKCGGPTPLFCWSATFVARVSSPAMNSPPARGWDTRATKLLRGGVEPPHSDVSVTPRFLRGVSQGMPRLLYNAMRGLERAARCCRNRRCSDGFPLTGSHPDKSLPWISVPPRQRARRPMQLEREWEL